MKIMDALFIESRMFEKLRESYLSDDEFRIFQKELMIEPHLGDLIVGTGGLRKVRVGLKGRGKRGGGRVIYYYLDAKSRFYLLTIYAKNEMKNLTANDKRTLKQFIEEWKNE